MALGVGTSAASSRTADSPNRNQDKVNIVANDATNGTGAERLNARIIAGEKKPLKAVGEPIVIGQRVTVGGNYPFQDTADATAALADYFNNVLGGVGADYKNGKPGRPIKIELCTSELATTAAQGCANQLLAKNPLAIFDTLNLTQAAEYAIYSQAGVPVIEGTTLTPTQLSNPNIPTIDGGCFTSAAIPMVHAMKTMKYKKVAFITSSNLASSQACLKAYENIKLQYPKTDFEVFPYVTTDPDQLAVAQQVVTFDPDAVIVQSSGTNCSQFWSAWDQLSYKGQVYNASSCQSPALFKTAADLVKGDIFNFAGDNAEAPNSFYKDYPLSKVEFAMTDEALQAYKPGGVFTANARNNANKFMWLAGVLDQMALKGTTFNAQSLLTAVAAEKYHLPNGPTPDCSLKVPNFTSMCNFQNSLWQVKSVDADGNATWKLIVKDLDTSEQYRKLSGSTATTTTTVAK